MIVANGVDKKLTIGFVHDRIPEQCTPKEKQYFKEHGEWDSEQTIDSITTALSATGARVIPIEVHPNNLEKSLLRLLKYKSELDIVFNIAEYFGTKNRESIVPAILEGLHLPYTGSDLAAQANAMNKATALEIVKNYGIHVAPSIVFGTDDLTKLSIRKYAERLEGIFPLIVKPLAEGTSMGMTQNSVVENLEELRTEVKRMIDGYKQPAIVQRFLDGKEYTVGILGNNVLPILQIDLKKIPKQPKVRDHDVKEIDGDYSVPAKFNEAYIYLAAQAAIAHTALSCRDYNRMDFREHSDGKIYFLEANPLPGLDPSYSDFPKIARLAGISHDNLINMILHESISRYQPIAEFQEKLSAEKVAKIKEYITPIQQSLETYPYVRLEAGVDAQPQDNLNATYQLVRVKKEKTTEKK